MSVRTSLIASCVAILLAIAGCGKDGTDGASCTVESSDDALTISCGDGKKATLRAPKVPDASVVEAPPAKPCTVARADDMVTVACPDGSSVVIPPPEQGGCAVSAPSADGSVTITCKDGSTATIPGPKPAPDASVPDSGTPSNKPLIIGATRAACGACHDSTQAKAHFAAMTEEVDGKVEETCFACHSESSVEPATRVHLRAELSAPGFVVAIDDVSIDGVTRKPTARLRLTDQSGASLSREPSMSFNFVIAKVEQVLPASAPNANEPKVAGSYINYLLKTVTQQESPSFPISGAPRVVEQPTSEAATGTFTEVSTGVYDYTFSYALPEGFDVNATHVVGLYATRTVDAVVFVANATRFFVPSNPSATVSVRNVVSTSSCNTCHNPLKAHGGARQDVQLCLTCHTQGAIDPESGNSLDFKVMVHRIHRGEKLPSVARGTPYRVIGYQGALHDYSKVNYPRDILECESCHASSNSNSWLINAGRAACTACHENIDQPAEQGGHPFPLNAGASCGSATCHSPRGYFPDASESHKTFLNTSDAPVFDIAILSVTARTPDETPVVRVRARTGTRATGAVTPVLETDRLPILQVFLNGPNTGYVLNGHNIKQYAKAELVELLPDGARPGEFVFKLPQSLRAAVSGVGDPTRDSFTLAIRAQYDPTPGAAPDNDRIDMLRNPTFAFGATDEGTPIPRLSSADTEKCNRCHGVLSGHGGAILAKNVEECAMCHTASLDTSVRQGANKVAGSTTSLRLSTLVHRIHAADVAGDRYSAYGFSLMAPYPEIDLSEVPFPGDPADCASCHRDAAELVPLTGGSQPSTINVLDVNGTIVTP